MMTTAWWENEEYEGQIRRFSGGSPFGGGPWATISVGRKDKTCARDWRDLQRIKNDLCGHAWEAMELYPAESRLIDSSNQTHLWCFPKVPVGFFPDAPIVHREDVSETVGQRGWEPGTWPWNPPV